MTTPRNLKPRITFDANPDLLPDELTALNRWVNWTPVWNKAQQCWDNPPVDGNTARRIDCTNPANLKSLAQVLEAQERARQLYRKARGLPPKERAFVTLYGVGFSVAKGLPGLQ